VRRTLDAAADRLRFDRRETAEISSLEGVLGTRGIDQVVAHDERYAEVSGQALQPACPVHRIADDREREILPVADVADGDGP
jgi:hypothetical protein